MSSIRQKRPIITAKTLLNFGRILQYHISWNLFVLLATDCSLSSLSIAFLTSQQKTACFTQSLSPFYCLLHRAIALFINLLCSIDDYTEMGQVYRYPVLLRTTSKLDLHIATRLAGIIAQEASQYFRIQGYLVFLRTYFTQAATILKSFLALSTSSSIYSTLQQRQVRQSDGQALRHMVLGIYTKAYPSKTMSRSIPQIVAKHLRKTIKPISDPASKNIKRIRATIAITKSTRQNMPLIFRLRFILAQLYRSPASYHSCSTGIIVQVKIYTSQQSNKYCMPSCALIFQSGCPLSVWYTSSGTSKASPKLRTQVITDQTLTCMETSLLEQQLTRQTHTTVRMPYSISAQSI